jgi:hypothetical protein
MQYGVEPRVAMGAISGLGGVLLLPVLMVSGSPSRVGTDMVVVLACTAAFVILAAAMVLPAEAGTRNGDYSHDTTLTITDRRHHARAIGAELHNPDSRPVLVGLSIHSRSRFYRPAGGFSVRAPLRTCHPHLFASRQTVFAILLPHQTATWHLTVPDEPSPFQLEAVIEQADRLRLIRHVLSTSPTERPEHGL